METEVQREEATCLEYQDNDDRAQHSSLDCLTSPWGCHLQCASVQWLFIIGHPFLALVWLAGFNGECTVPYRLFYSSEDKEKICCQSNVARRNGECWLPRKSRQSKQEPRSCQGDSPEEAQIYSEPQWMSKARVNWTKEEYCREESKSHERMWEMVGGALMVLLHAAVVEC